MNQQEDLRKIHNLCS